MNKKTFEPGDLVISTGDSAEPMTVCIVTGVNSGVVSRCHLSRRLIRNAGKKLWLKYKGSSDSLNHVLEYGWTVGSVLENEDGDIVVRFAKVAINTVTYSDGDPREFRTDGYALVIPKRLYKRLSEDRILPYCLRLTGHPPTPSPMTPPRPMMRYHGGKWLLAPWIISFFGPHRTYVEPFGGAASVLLRKPRAYGEVLNDLNGEVVNLYRVLRDQKLELAEMIRLTPYAREEFDLAYEPTEDPLEQARRSLVRASMGFGSAGIQTNYRTGFRGNVSRTGTHPAGDFANMPEVLLQVSERLRGVVIENRPAVEVIQQYDGAETLHYLDPPYVHDSRKSARVYNCEMSDADHIELLACAMSAKGMVILSGYAHELYDSTLQGWTSFDRATLADGARARVERLWLNPAAVAAMPNQLLIA